MKRFYERRYQVTDRIELIVCDIDNTLPVNSGKINKSFLSVAETFQSKNKTFCLASGRNYPEMFDLADKFQCTYICSDGALTVENGRIVKGEEIEKSVLKEIFSRTKSSFLLYSFLNVYCVSEDKDFIVNQKEKYGIYLKEVKTLEEVTESVYKVAFWGADDFDGALRYVTMNKKLIRVYNFSGWKEFVKYGVNKGTALKTILKEKNIKDSNCCAFGDNTNDIEMLKAVRHSFAVSNAKQEVKRLCKYITEDTEKEILKILESEEKK